MIILLSLLIIASMVLMVRARKPMAFWMAGVFFGWFLSMMGYIIFLSKYGGYYYRVNQILYLFDDIRVFFLNFSISINWISRMLSVGRSIFVISLIGLSFAIATVVSPKTRSYLFRANFVMCLVNILIYEPAFYRKLLYLLQSQFIYVISIVIRVWILLTVVCTFYCLLNKYSALRLQFLKKQIKYIILCVFALTLFYFYLIFMGPIQLTDIRTYYFLYTNFANFNPPLSILQWMVFIGFTGVTSVLSIFSIWKYSDVEKRLDTLDLSYEQKFLSVNNGVSVITHSLKNQLLMIDVLAKKIDKEINQSKLEEKIKVAEVARNLHEISAITSQTLQRITQLYKAFKSISFNFEPYIIAEIVAKSLENIKHIPVNIKIEKNINGPMTVLADSMYLIEAISNLIINAFEAIGGKPDGKVSIQAHLEGDWCVLEIADNGIGIAPNELDKIFDPFYTRKITTKNWGIGLSYAKQIIKSHFGYLQVKSQIQKGSTFSVVLPVINSNTNKIQKRDG
jgi:signal transduction histidine kinase